MNTDYGCCGRQNLFDGPGLPEADESRDTGRTIPGRICEAYADGGNLEAGAGGASSLEGGTFPLTFPDVREVMALPAGCGATSEFSGLAGGSAA